MKKYKLGIALGGGGARGFAHLGMLKGLVERGYKPDVISGVSAGAIAGVFFASGKSCDEIHISLKNTDLFSPKNLSFPTKGLLQFNTLKNDLSNGIEVDNIEDLKIPFYVGVANLNSGKMEYKNSGRINKLVLASSSVPFLFHPVEYEGQLYADGGIIENLPVNPLLDQCEQVFGLNISPVGPRKTFKNIIHIATRMFQMHVEASTRMQKELCDVVLEPPKLMEFDFLKSKLADEMFEVGYNYVMDFDF